MNWSPRQRAVFDFFDSEDRVAFVVGPVQSGKSISASYAFFRWAAMHFEDSTFLLCGRSARQLHATVLLYGQRFASLIGSEWKRKGEAWTMGSIGGRANRFYPLLGGDAGSEERARSYPAAGALIDEATTLEDGFVNAVHDRCSHPRAKIIMVTNPSGPKHPLKLRYIDEAPLGVQHHPFALADNPTLSEAYVASLNARYGEGTAMHRRMVMGEWAAAEGLVYPDLDAALCDPPPAGGMQRWTVGVDFALSSVTHAVLTGTAPDGVRHVYSEWRHDGQAKGQLSEQAQARRIALWLAGRNVSRVAVDPSATAMIAALDRELPGVRVVAGDNDILNGVGWVRSEMERGHLKINRRLDKLVEEMANYSWDEYAGERGTDKPEKRNDHGPDALRYDQWTGAGSRGQIRILKGRRRAAG